MLRRNSVWTGYARNVLLCSDCLAIRYAAGIDSTWGFYYLTRRAATSSPSASRRVASRRVASRRVVSYVMISPRDDRCGRMRGGSHTRTSSRPHSSFFVLFGVWYPRRTARIAFPSKYLAISFAILMIKSTGIPIRSNRMNHAYKSSESAFLNYYVM